MEKRTIKKIFTAASACLLMAISNVGFARNPIVTDLYTADPSAHVWADGRLYVYPSHDITNNCATMDKYHVYSTDDMVHWFDHGEILSTSQLSWGTSGCMWAPDCAYKNGIYYFYYPHTISENNWKIGVATSTSPTGGFVDKGYIQGIESYIDPCVFVDTDGQVYFYFGGGGTCKGGKLKDNMMEIDGEMQKMTGLEDFHEATWVHKRNDTYYLSYSDNLDGKNRLRYATSTSPLGPWTYRGIYMESTDSGTDHGSIVEFKGQWYAFYHTSTLSRQDWLRSVCVDPLYYNADGTIQTVIQTPRRAYSKMEAERFKGQSGIQLEECSDRDGGLNLCRIDNNDYAVYQDVNFNSGGADAFNVRVASSSRGGTIEIRLDSLNGALVGQCAIPATGGRQNWVTKSCIVRGASGIRDVYLTFKGKKGNLFSLNWFEFSTSSLLGRTISLKCTFNNLFVSSEDGKSSMLCNRSVVGSWEKFVVTDAGNGKIALSASNRLFMHVEDGGTELKSNQSTIGYQETFEMIKNSDETVSLKGSNGRYVSGNTVMRCDAEKIDVNQRFIVKTVD